MLVDEALRPWWVLRSKMGTATGVPPPACCWALQAGLLLGEALGHWWVLCGSRAKEDDAFGRALLC